MFQQWSPARLFGLIHKEIRADFTTGSTQPITLLSSPEHWKKFREHVGWKDIRASLVERAISILKDLSDPDCKTPQVALQAALGEIDWFLNLPDTLEREAEASRAGTQQEK
jgi:hypothetical protein